MDMRLKMDALHFFYVVEEQPEAWFLISDCPPLVLWICWRYETGFFYKLRPVSVS